MNLSAKTEYACLAVLELAKQHANSDPVRIRSIADIHGIPSRFLVQILLQLKNAGIVTSTRGAAGGYRLAREPAEISLLDVVTVVEGEQREVQGNATVDTENSAVLLAVWNEISEVQRELLATTSMADLAEQAIGHSDQMYYI